MLEAPPLKGQALVYSPPEGLLLADPYPTPARPRQFTVFQGHLWVHPAPDQRYQLAHYFFAGWGATAAWSHLPAPVRSR